MRNTQQGPFNNNYHQQHQEQQQPFVLDPFLFPGAWTWPQNFQPMVPQGQFIMDNNFPNGMMPYDNHFASQQDYISLEEDHNQFYQGATSEPLQGISRPHTHANAAQGRYAEQIQTPRPTPSQALGVHSASNAPHQEAAPRKGTPGHYSATNDNSTSAPNNATETQRSAKPAGILFQPPNTSTRSTPAPQKAAQDRSEEHSTTTMVPQVKVSQHSDATSQSRTMSAPTEHGLNTIVTPSQANDMLGTQTTSAGSTPTPHNAVKEATDRAANLRAKIIAGQAKKAQSATPEINLAHLGTIHNGSTSIASPVTCSQPSMASSSYHPPSDADIDALFSDARAAIDPTVNTQETSRVSPRTSPKTESTKMPLPGDQVQAPRHSTAAEARPPPTMPKEMRSGSRSNEENTGGRRPEFLPGLGGDSYRPPLDSPIPPFARQREHGPRLSRSPDTLSRPLQKRVESPRLRDINQPALEYRPKEPTPSITESPPKGVQGSTDPSVNESDVRDWLNITGYHDIEYRTKHLSRHRRIAELEQQREKLLKEQEDEVVERAIRLRKHSTAISGSPETPTIPKLDPSKIPDLKAPGKRLHSPDSKADKQDKIQRAYQQQCAKPLADRITEDPRRLSRITTPPPDRRDRSNRFGSRARQPSPRGEWFHHRRDDDRRYHDTMPPFGRGRRDSDYRRR